MSLKETPGQRKALLKAQPLLCDNRTAQHDGGGRL